MKTASWRTYFGPGRIGISLGVRGVRAGYKVFRPLNPTREMLHLPHEEFDAQYAQILAELDPLRVWTDLHALAGNFEPYLMCWEVPPFTEANRCHRRQVSAWFEEQLGEAVPELVI